MDDHCSLPVYIVNDAEPIMTLSQTVGWGLQKLKIQELHNQGLTGKGVKVGVLDTGADLNHPDLKITKALDFTRSGSPQDKSGHGTHTAGIIAAQGNDFGTLGVSPGVDLYIYKVLGGNTGSLMDVANGIRKAGDDGMDIISMSLGSTADAPYMKQACQYAISKGSIIVCSSGNSGRDQKFYPASYSFNYAIGAINKQFNVSGFSTYGSQLEYVAPGERILSTYLNGGFAVLSGTSMSCPFVSGCFALMKEAGVTMTYENLIKAVIDILDPDFDKKSGYGIINPQVLINTPVESSSLLPSSVVTSSSIGSSISNKIAIKKELSTIYQSTMTIEKLL